MRPASRRIVKRYYEAAAKFWKVEALPDSIYRSRSADSSNADSAGLLDIAQRVGLPLVAGTDAGDESLLNMPPGFNLHLELAVRVVEGLSPLEALRSATLNPAKLLHSTDSLGTVAADKLADLVLLDANPLADIANTTAIRAVVANGRYFDRSALDAILADVQAQSRPALLAHCAEVYFSDQCYRRVKAQPQP